MPVSRQRIFPGIFVVDSGTTTVGQGIIVELALSLSQKGLSAKEIADRLDREKEKITVVALVDTLEYLKKGGRIFQNRRRGGYGFKHKAGYMP